MLGLYGGNDYLKDEETLAIQQLLQERDLENIPFLFVIRKEEQVNGEFHCFFAYSINPVLPICKKVKTSFKIFI